MLENFDPPSASDEALRTAVLLLMNEVERLSLALKDAQDDNRRLQEEIRRLKGGPGQPTVPYAEYLTQRRRLADGEAGSQARRRLHRDPVDAVTALLQRHAARRAALAAPRPLLSLEHTD